MDTLKLVENSEFNHSDIALLSSIGDAFPVYDYITLESIAGVTILNSSSELIANYILVQYLKEVIAEIRRAAIALEAKQVLNEHLTRYLKAEFNFLLTKIACRLTQIK
ncbi:putative conjugative transfer protein TraH [Orientia chuto str. Dubai]|uniref:Putative conjugative transfer protein TraH n=1 Tax=Orientia chuto str. Dubai TaxID=1359168 RepID=A0A0F3MKU9_9RICK|nr:hypothetical protein [Candidatus Orientia mediorientalis]KJV55214.1 putative conjugative transfer protein TraH [Orientia chuto str. Dubai]